MEVTCSKARWRIKIEQNRPELIGRERDVQATIAEPEIVFEDRNYPDRKHHIRVLPNGLYLKVVTGYQYDPESQQVRGRFVTAFLQDKLRDGDTPLYMRIRR